MRNNIIFLLKIFILFLLFILSVWVRKRNFAEIPIPGQSVDEYSYSWVGLSLIESGVPVGISGIEGYKNSIVKYVNVDRIFQTVSTGEPLTINYPWMDHPPLMGLITGGFAYFSGARVFEDTTSNIIRKPIIIISSLSVVFLSIFAWLNFGFITAVVAGLLYSTTPLVVISGRMIQAENGIIPSLLLCMIFLSLYLKGGKDKWLVLAALIAGVATLFKLTGFVCHLMVLFVLLDKYKYNWRKTAEDFGFFLIISLPISFLFVIYGAVYGMDNFVSILFSNYNRFYGIGANSLIELIRNQRLTQHKFLPEVSITCGWMVFVFYVVKRRVSNGTGIVLKALIAYTIVYIFFGSQPYGWYTFPFWPLLILLLSSFMVKGYYLTHRLYGSLFVMLVMLGANVSRLINVFEFQVFANYWRLGVSFALFMTVIMVIFRKSNLFVKVGLVVIFAAIVWSNLQYLYNINLDYWWNNIS